MRTFIETSTKEPMLKHHLIEIAIYLKKTQNQPKQIHLLSWDPPLQGFLKIDVDGSIEGAPCAYATRGCCQDETRQWIFGFSQQLGEGYAIHAELFAIWKEVELA
ncbi:hypothetical protein SLA2020_400180 [Shorea laevis]